MPSRVGFAYRNTDGRFTYEAGTGNGGGGGIVIQRVEGDHTYRMKIFLWFE